MRLIVVDTEWTAEGAERNPLILVNPVLSEHDGKVLWKRVLREEQPHEGTHATGSWASSSAATDGEVVIAFFGSRGIYALDMDGSRSGRRTSAT